MSSDELTSILAASSLDDVEITDDGWAEMLTGVTRLMSREAAVNNPEIIDEIVESAKGKIIQNTLHSLEVRMKSFAQKAGLDLGDAKKAHEILTVFDEKIGEVFDNNDEKTKGLIDSYKKDLEKRNSEIGTLKADHTAEIEQMTQDSLKRELKTQFELQAKGQNWAEHYSIPSVNKALTDQIWSEINSQATLKFEDGVIKPYAKDHSDKELYIDNSKATFEDLVNPKYEPYLKKSTKPETKTDGIFRKDNSNREGATSAEISRARMERAHPINE